ncbi:MAG: DsrE family protein [Pseudomonadota bacterium]
MATLLISGSDGTNDPTMASLPFMAAGAAKAQGHDVVIWLWNEAVTLARRGTAEHIQGVNLKLLGDVLADVVTAGIPIWVCSACAVARNVALEDLVTGAVIKEMPDYIEAVTERDRLIPY